LRYGRAKVPKMRGKRQQEASSLSERKSLSLSPDVRQAYLLPHGGASSALRHDCINDRAPPTSYASPEPICSCRIFHWRFCTSNVVLRGMRSIIRRVSWRDGAWAYCGMLSFKYLTERYGPIG
jgi:hypothetical protein